MKESEDDLKKKNSTNIAKSTAKKVEIKDPEENFEIQNNTTGKIKQNATNNIKDTLDIIKMEIKNSEKDLEASETATEEIKQSNNAQPETMKLVQKTDTQSHTESQNTQEQDSIQENPTKTIIQPQGIKSENKKEPQVVNNKQKNKKTSKTIHEAIKKGTQISKENKEKILEKMRINKISAEKNHPIKSDQTHSTENRAISKNNEMSITELEISDSIQNGTKINRGRVMEILELMRDTESKSRHTISSGKNDTTIKKTQQKKA